MGDVIHINFAEAHQKREIASEPFIVFTSMEGVEYEITMDDSEFDWEGALTPEDFPLPETEYTLFGWSVRIYDHTQGQWFTLPAYYKSEAAALAMAEAYLLAIDFNPYNDNGDGEWID